VPKKEVVGAAAVLQAVERKQFTQPTGKFNSGNIGIKSTLNPVKKKVGAGQEENLKQENEAYTPDQFNRAWKEFALGVKREKKDSLFTTLMSCEKTIDSNHLITILIHNSIQQTELDDCKGDLVRLLRVNLKNTNINLTYKLTEKKSVKVMDSKATFDKLAEENSSLNKFRKLFNLDIEF
jgi:hypothetical protein